MVQSVWQSLVVLLIPVGLAKRLVNAPCSGGLRQWCRLILATLMPTPWKILLSAPRTLGVELTSALLMLNKTMLQRRKAYPSLPIYT